MMCMATLLTSSGVEFPPIQRMQYHDAMRDYGIDKPDLRYGMLLHDLTSITQVRPFYRGPADL